MEALYGTGVALVTPFDEAGNLDKKALERVVEHCVEHGVDYLVVLGTTAETATLTAAEKQEVIRTVVAANEGRLPLVLGIGGNNTAEVAQTMRTTDLKDFDAVLSVSPYYNKPTQEGIYRHFEHLANACPKPIILYNVPSRTGSNMLPETTLRLARDFDNIIAIKEACGNMEQVKTIIAEKPKGFLMISGDDITALPTVLAGGAGVISVLGQGLPNAFSEMIRFGLNGQEEDAQALHDLLAPGMDLIFREGNPAGIKAIFEILGICGAQVRLPLVQATPALKKEIRSFVEQVQQAPAAGH